MEAKTIGGRFGFWASWPAPIMLLWLLHGLDATEDRLISFPGFLAFAGGSAFCLYIGHTLGRWIATRLESGSPWFRALGWGCLIGVLMTFAFGIAWALAMALVPEHPHVIEIFGVIVLPFFASWMTIPYGIAVVFLLRWRLDIQI